MGLFLADFFRDLYRKVDGFIAGFGLNNDGLAQVGHFSVSYGLSFTAYVVGWAFGAWYAGLIVGGIISGPWVYWKEAVRDPQPPENAPFLWNGFKDACFYWGGFVLATVVAVAIGMAFPG